MCPVQTVRFPVEDLGSENAYEILRMEECLSLNSANSFELFNLMPSTYPKKHSAKMFKGEQ